MGNTCSCCSQSRSSSPNEEENEKNATVLPEVKDESHLDQVISFIEERLKAIAIDKAEESTSTADITTTSTSVASSIKHGGYLLENVLNRVKKHALEIFSSETRKVVVDVLKEAAQIHWVAAGLGVVAFVLDQIDKVSTNRRDCIELLRYMCALAKQIKELFHHNLPQEKLNDVVVFIVQGSFFCVSQMQSSNLSRFFSASVDVEEIRGLQSQLSHKYSDLTLDGVIRILNLMPTPLPPSQGEDPHGVGINEARNKVIELLNMKGDSTRAVVLYGIGGIGKTTLATAVFSSLNLIAYKHCRIDIDQNCSESNLQRLQHQVLGDLFGKNIELRSCGEGRNELSNAFTKSAAQPVFLFIDNALRRSDLAKLLPEDLSNLPKGSKILVTTRLLDQTDMLDQQPNIQRHSYMVNFLSHLDAKKLLCRRALGSADNSSEKSLDIDRLVKMCGGIPLVLLMAGSKLRKLGNNVSACNNTISFLEQSLEKGEGDLSERVVGEVYNSLEEDLYKEAFLDISVFFKNWKKGKVGYIVGEVALKALEEAALVTITEEGKVNVHDIVVARGRKLSEMDRITDRESFQNALKDTQRLQKLKGIWLPDNGYEGYETDVFQLEAKHLDLMNRSLRVLYLGSGNEFSGESKSTFPNLRFLQIRSSLSMELKEFENLAVLQGKLWKGGKLCEFPDSLRLMEFAPYNLPGLPENFGTLYRLEELCLSSHYGYGNCLIETLPDSFGQLKSLRILRLEGCERLRRLPTNFGNLYSLEELELKSTGVECLPDSFGELNCLEEVDISGSYRLMSLPQSFSRLSRLKKLNMSRCKNLSRLPDKFSELSSMCAVDASECPGLDEKEMDKFAEMKSLLVLNIERSPLLIKRRSEIKETHPLFVMDDKLLPYSKYGQLRPTPFYYFERILYSALFDESRFLRNDGDLQLADWSSSSKVGLLLSMCDLCSPSNNVALEMVKEKIGELASQGVQILYIRMGECGQESEDRIRQRLVELPGGIQAWIAADERSNKLLGYSVYRILYPFYRANWSSPRWSQQIVQSVHTVIAEASLSVDEQGKKRVRDVKLIFPLEGKEEAVVDTEGGFKRLFFPIVELEKFAASYYYVYPLE